MKAKKSTKKVKTKPLTAKQLYALGNSDKEVNLYNKEVDRYNAKVDRHNGV